MKSHVEHAQAHVLSATTYRTVERSLRAVLQRLRRWHALYRERQRLGSLSDEMLKDIGLSRADVETEINRPFWDEPFRRG